MDGKTFTDLQQLPDKVLKFAQTTIGGAKHALGRDSVLIPPGCKVWVEYSDPESLRSLWDKIVDLWQAFYTRFDGDYDRILSVFKKWESTK